MINTSATSNDLGKINIDLNSLKFNYRLIKKIVGKECLVSAVLKANAYGLGAKEIGKILERLGCEIFFVANISEGTDLRKSIKKSDILVLNGFTYFNRKSLNLFLKSNLIPVINSLEDLENFALIKRNNPERLLRISLHFDTGMNRLGIPFKELNQVKKLVKKNKIDLFSIMSHLSSSDEPNNPKNFHQIDLFRKISRKFPDVKLSLANSSAIFNLKEFNFSYVRSGGAIFGINPIKTKNPLKNVISLFAKVIQLRNLNYEPIKSIGYNSSYSLSKGIKIAVLGVGYADGYPRNLSNIGFGFFKKTKLPIIGNISMDYMTVDLSNLKKKIKVGDWVELIGENITIQTVARQSETIEYEILNNLGNRLEKNYIKFQK